MSARRTERLLNLTMCLMAGRRPLSKATIRGLIADYREATSDESFERMFERDKDDLREMGIPLVTESIDPLFDDFVESSTAKSGGTCCSRSRRLACARYRNSPRCGRYEAPPVEVRRRVAR